MKKLIALWILLFPLITFADVTQWQIVPKESSLTFTATQNDAPVTGKFTQFTGEIAFDPAQLKASHIRIVVDMSSVSTDYADVAETLKTADWFNIKTFPEAIFTASDFTKTGDNSYQATGKLTIRAIIVPVVINFTMDEFSKTHARATGSLSLKRLAFGIGQGEWQKTTEVKDDVKVQFTVVAVSK